MPKLSKAKTKVLDEFERRTDDWKFGEFEQRLSQVMGSRYGNYQTAKATIADAHAIGLWPKTVRQYIFTNYKAFGNSPAELVPIFNQIWNAMPDQEKKDSGIEIREHNSSA